MNEETRIDLNGISKQFAETFFNNMKEDIEIDLFYFSDKIANGDFNSYNMIKLFKALFSYCGNRNIDLNKYFALKI